MNHQEFGHKPNLLILGASGGVASALLQLLHTYRHEIDKLILVDKRNDITVSPYINHKILNFKFVQMYINGHIPIQELSELIQAENISIMLDLTDSDTIPLLKLANQHSIAYINTSLNIDNVPVSVLTESLIEELRPTLTNSSSLLSVGMNPGIVNTWVVQGIDKYGLPEAIVEIEYDSAVAKDGWKPLITWSKKQFLNESVWDPTGVMIANRTYQELYPNALMNLADTTEYLKPLVDLSQYPQGMIVYHEEMMNLAKKYNVPAKFIYAINQQTIQYLQKVYQQKSTVDNEDIEQGDNINIKLTGTDLIGIWLIYKDKKVCYFNRMNHENCNGTNATLMQVAIGVIAALRIMFEGLVPKGVHFVEDINTYTLTPTIEQHMLTEHFVMFNEVESQNIQDLTMLLPNYATA